MTSSEIKQCYIDTLNGLDRGKAAPLEGLSFHRNGDTLKTQSMRERMQGCISHFSGGLVQDRVHVLKQFSVSIVSLVVCYPRAHDYF